MNDDVNKSAVEAMNDDVNKNADKEADEEAEITSDSNTTFYTNVELKPKSRRGFASMSKEKRTAISRLGGAAIPADKRSFSLNPKLAAEAGRKGGQTSRGGGRHKKIVPTE